MRVNEITFRHLMDFIDGQSQEVTPQDTPQAPKYANSPKEETAPITASFPSGTDMHHSKNPADIKADSISMYPNHQHKPGHNNG
jgi:hypothetical protein